MELRVLKYFLVTAQERNITRAAEILHITQPTLSRQLMDLEEELNTTLFIRGKKEITLTNDGIFLKERAQEIVELSDKTKNDFVNHKNTVSGTISIGCVEAVSVDIFSDIIKSFSKKYPNINFDMFNGYVDDIKEKIDKGLIDVGLILEPAEISKYDFVRLNQKERYGILIKKDNPLAEKESISLDEIASCPLILPKRGVVQNEIRNWSGSPLKEPMIFATYNLFSNAVLLVERDLGCAVCLEGALSLKNNPETKFIPFTPERATTGLIVWKKNYILSQCASLFVEEIKNTFKA